jgi:hypothetical protein
MKANLATAFILTHAYGMTRAELLQLAQLEPLCPVVCRFHEGRLVCAAQDATEIVKRLEASGWGVRDVAPALPRLEQARADATRAAQAAELRRQADAFNEADCGGAFDGFRVTSDADPGL